MPYFLEDFDDEIVNDRIDGLPFQDDAEWVNDGIDGMPFPDDDEWINDGIDGMPFPDDDEDIVEQEESNLKAENKVLSKVRSFFERKSNIN